MLKAKRAGGTEVERWRLGTRDACVSGSISAGGAAETGPPAPWRAGHGAARGEGARFDGALGVGALGGGAGGDSTL